MKLLRLTSLSHFAFSLLVLVISFFLTFKLIRTVVNEESVEKLILNKERIVGEIEKGNFIHLPPIVEIHKDSSALKDTLLVSKNWVFDPLEEEQEFFTEITSYEEINGVDYKIILRQSRLEPHDYINSMWIVFIFACIILLIGVYILNFFISKSIWSSFHSNLDKLKQFNLDGHKKITMDPSRIKEFNELNTSVENLMRRVESEYSTIKEFSENASHEIQTPLAIIQSQLEELIQKPGLDAQDYARINNALSSCQRLSRLNQALLLITKIGNRQFNVTEQLNISQEVRRALVSYQDFIQGRKLNVIYESEKDYYVQGSQILAELLITNILANSIKHNIDGGEISIQLTSSSLKICNTGSALSLPPEKLFGRFVKSDPSSSSLGLGLAIVQKICDVSAWKAEYSFQENKHCMEIFF